MSLRILYETTSIDVSRFEELLKIQGLIMVLDLGRKPNIDLVKALSLRLPIQNGYRCFVIATSTLLIGELMCIREVDPLEQRYDGMPYRLFCFSLPASEVRERKLSRIASRRNISFDGNWPRA